MGWQYGINADTETFSVDWRTREVPVHLRRPGRRAVPVRPTRWPWSDAPGDDAQRHRNLHVFNAPYPIQFGRGDWITVVTNATGTFTGEMTLPDGTVIPPTGKAFDVEFGQTTKWAGDQLIIISAFLDTALQREQIGLA